MNEPETKKRMFGKNSALMEIIKFIVIALIVIGPVRMFIAQPFVVSGSSMVPTFETNEYLIVDEISYKFSKPERGDVIVFRYPNDTSKFFIKRIIGLPGETVVIEGSEVFIKDTEGNKNKLEEPYIKLPAQNFLEVEVGEGEYFVMGDNREASSDSRVWGTLDDRYLIGRALVRLFPVKRLDFYPGNAEFEF